MRASLKNYMAACNRRKEETGESGFSLIELIVVVVILGILAAIAVPVFTGLQAEAEKNAVATIAANGATQVASDIAQGKDATAITAGLTKLEGTADGVKLSVGSNVTIDGFCVTATKGTDITQKSGPGCTTP